MMPEKCPSAEVASENGSGSSGSSGLGDDPAIGLRLCCDAAAAAAVDMPLQLGGADNHRVTRLTSP